MKVFTKSFYLSSCFFLIFVISGCQQNLSRDLAEKLLSSNEDIINKSQKLMPANNHIKTGHDLGFWDAVYYDFGKYRLSNIINDISQSTKAINIDNIEPSDRIKYKIEVTGIRDYDTSSNKKTAEFVFEYINMPTPLKPIILKGEKGTALFTLYDDGWRIENIDINTKLYYTLTNQEFNIIEGIKKNTQKRREFEELQKQKAEEERQLAISESKISNKVLYSGNASKTYYENWGTKHIYEFFIKISDSNFVRKAKEIYQVSNNKPQITDNRFDNKIWYGNIIEIMIGTTDYKGYGYKDAWRGTEYTSITLVLNKKHEKHKGTYLIKLRNGKYASYMSIPFSDNEKAHKVYKLLNKAVDDWREKYLKRITKQS